MGIKISINLVKRQVLVSRNGKKPKVAFDYLAGDKIIRPSKHKVIRVSRGTMTLYDFKHNLTKELR